MNELLEADTALRWLVRGVAIDPTYGQIAGELKTLKTYVSMLLIASVASGQPLFGQFPVERSGPVLVYVGEGGRLPYTRRLKRVAHSLGIEPAELSLFTSYDVAPVTSNRFQESLLRDLAELEPAMVVVDPLYAFHGSATDSRNLHEEGGLLTSISAPCIAAGATCWIVNHFNQTGSRRPARASGRTPGCCSLTARPLTWLLVGSG
jgi:RecA-family ATPase